MDTIHLNLSSNDVTQSQWNSICDNFNTENVIVNADYRILTKGVGNLRISCSPASYSIKGSLTKFLAGNNCESLEFEDIKEGFRTLKDTLDVPLDKAKVYRIDFASNVLLNHPPEFYYKYLGSAPNLKNRNKYSHTLSFTNSYRGLHFYNKKQQVMATSGEIPKVWENENVLRYEMRVDKYVDRYFKRNVFGSTLCDEDFHVDLWQHWHKEYQKISKEKVLKIDFESCKSPKAFRKQLGLYALQELGLSESLEMVEQLKLSKSFKNRSQYSVLNKSIKDSFSSSKKTKTNIYVQELDGKMKSIAKYYR